VIVQVSTFDTDLEMDDVTKFDPDQFVESVSSSQDDAEEVVVDSVTYQVEVQYKLPETLTENSVQDMIAAAQAVPKENVDAKKSVRRLAASPRRLAVAWDVTIKTPDASAVDSIATKAENKEAIQVAAQDLGISSVTVEVASPPKKKVSVQFKVKSKPNAAQAVQTIDTAKLTAELGNKLGVNVSAGPVDFQGKEEETQTPSTSPTADFIDEAASTSPSDELVVNSGTKTLSCLLAFQLVLAGTLAALRF